VGRLTVKDARAREKLSEFMFERALDKSESSEESESSLESSSSPSSSFCLAARYLFWSWRREGETQKRGGVSKQRTETLQGDSIGDSPYILYQGTYPLRSSSRLWAWDRRGKDRG